MERVGRIGSPSLSEPLSPRLTIPFTVPPQGTAAAAVWPSALARCEECVQGYFAVAIGRDRLLVTS